jgi:DNA-binding MarR family transcriptional regulator
MSPMTELLRLDDQVCFALHAATRAVTGAYQPLLESLDVTYPQYLVLLVLWEEDGARVSRIGSRLYLDSATLTPLLKRLAARGLVERRRSVADERVVEVYLTAEGKQLKRRAADLPRQLLGKTKLSATELKQLRACLQGLTKTLHDNAD